MAKEPLEVVLYVRVTKADEKALERLVLKEAKRRPYDRVDRADVLRSIIGKALEGA